MASATENRFINLYINGRQAYQAKLSNKDSTGHPERDLSKEVLVKVLNREVPPLITAQSARDIITAIRLRDEFGFDLIIDGGAEAYSVIDSLKAAKVPVIIHPTMIRNFGDTRHPSSDKVAAAVEIIRKTRPDIAVDGEMQADTAVVADIVEQRYAFSAVKDANVLVFPDLNSANISYKLLSRLSNAEAIGPVLLGLGAPVHVLQMGAEVDDIVAMTAVAVMDAQRRG